MFNKKVKVEVEKERQVKCVECKHYIDITDAQFVFYEGNYYCPIHKRPYDEAYYYGSDNKTRYFKNVPAKTIEVDVKGRPIKNTK